MTPPINIDGTQITGASIDGQDVSAITVDGTQVFSAGIPDSNVFHFAADDLSLTDGATVSSWPDKSTRANGLTNINGAPTFETNQINGLPTVRYDGSDDRHESKNTVSTLSQPIVVFLVYQAIDVSGTNRPFNFNDTNGVEFNTEASFQIFAGNQVTGGTGDTNVHGAELVYNGSSSELNIDGSTVASGNADTRGVNAVSLGARFQNDFFTNMRVGQLVAYQNPSSGIKSDARSGLSSKWGVTF